MIIILWKESSATAVTFSHLHIFQECNSQTDILFKTNIVDAAIWVLLCAEKNLRCLDFDAKFFRLSSLLCFTLASPLPASTLFPARQRIWDEDSYRSNILKTTSPGLQPLFWGPFGILTLWVVPFLHFYRLLRWLPWVSQWGRSVLFVSVF